ncbi:hypothetical protein, partial [Flavihumibacter cheonanensis]|uniref:hypothetical protein n=1 Tax=Flavihumibacter cheonanensis TaxID=1442385 RepID=UPI001EF7B095
RFARLWKQAPPVCTASLDGLPGTFDGVHIGRGAAHIRDDPLEIRMHRHFPGLRDNGSPASGCHPAPLMNGDGAEITFPVASPVGGDGKPDGRK